jgi:hypothetical protein
MLKRCFQISRDVCFDCRTALDDIAENKISLLDIMMGQGMQLGCAIAANAFYIFKTLGHLGLSTRTSFFCFLAQSCNSALLLPALAGGWELFKYIVMFEGMRLSKCVDKEMPGDPDALFPTSLVKFAIVRVILVATTFAVGIPLLLAVVAYVWYAIPVAVMVCTAFLLVCGAPLFCAHRCRSRGETVTVRSMAGSSIRALMFKVSLSTSKKVLIRVLARVSDSPGRLLDEDVNLNFKQQLQLEVEVAFSAVAAPSRSSFHWSS